MVYHEKHAMKSSRNGYKVFVKFGEKILEEDKHPSSTINKWALRRRLKLTYDFTEEEELITCKISLANYLISEASNTNKKCHERQHTKD